MFLSLIQLFNRTALAFQGLKPFTNYWLVKAQSHAMLAIMAHGKQAARRQYDALVQVLLIPSVVVDLLPQIELTAIRF